MADRSDLDTLVEEAALELVHRHKLDEIEAALIRRAVTREAAERLVLIIPSAFAREHFEPAGIEFPGRFLVGPPGHYVERSYEAEPFYAAARSLARRWIAESRLTLVTRVLDWSAEADAIKKAKEQGLTPARMSIIHHGFSVDFEQAQPRARRSAGVMRIVWMVLAVGVLALVIAAAALALRRTG